MCPIIKGSKLGGAVQWQMEHWGPRGSDLCAYPRPEGGLPALINEVDGQGADDEDTQAGDEHVVDGAEMLHLHQLAAGTGARRSVWEGPQVRGDQLRHDTHVG